MSELQDNSSISEKIALRRYLIEQLGGPDKCRVLETHCGYGRMKESVYGGVSKWTGVDRKRGTAGIVSDSRKFLRSIDCREYNFFDIDPYGDFSEHLWLVSQKYSRDHRTAIAVTSGVQGGLATKLKTIGIRSRQVYDAIRPRWEDPPWATSWPRKIYAIESNPVILNYSPRWNGGYHNHDVFTAIVGAETLLALKSE